MVQFKTGISCSLLLLGLLTSLTGFSREKVTDQACWSLQIPAKDSRAVFGFFQSAEVPGVSSFHTADKALSVKCAQENSCVVTFKKSAAMELHGSGYTYMNVSDRADFLRFRKLLPELGDPEFKGFHGFNQYGDDFFFGCSSDEMPDVFSCIMNFQESTLIEDGDSDTEAKNCEELMN